MNQEIKLFTPSEPQRRALDIVYNERPFVTCLKYGRQTGKSYLGLMDMITRGLNNPRTKIRYVVPSYSLATKHMMTIDNLFAEHQDVKNKIFKSIKYKEQTYTLHNGAVIMFLSAEAEDNLRGDTCDFMYIDEAAFIKETTYTEILLPMLTRTGGRVMMFSTPNGKNWFFDLYMKGLDPKNRKLVQSIEATYLDLKDEADYESIVLVIEALRASMTKAAFNREVMGEFISDLSLFTGVKIAVKSDDWYKQYENTITEVVDGIHPLVVRKFIGIDIGVVHDYTVLTCIDENMVVRDIDRFNMVKEGYTSREFRERIAKFVKKHDAELMSGYIEINNNHQLYDDLINESGLYKLWDVTTTAKNKPEMVNVLVKLFDDCKISIPQHLQLEKELYAFTAIQNKITNKWQYKGTENIHDDMVMSLILAAYCWFEETNSGYTDVY